MVVVSGTMARFTCLTDLTIDRLCWDRYVRDTDKKLKWITLCTTSGCRSRYSHTSADMRFRQHSLMIESCNATDSGRYRCEVCDSRDTRQAARLVVIERMPECRINVISAVRVGDFIQLQCKVNYSGLWIPHFFCFQQHHSEQRQTPIPATERPTVRRNTAGYISETFTSVISVSSDNNGDTYRCTMNFTLSTETSPTAEIDSRPPAFNFTWVSTPSLDVQYGPLRVRITLMQRNSLLLKHGEILRCESDGNPSPEYTWLDATTGQRLHGGDQLTFDVCRHFNCGDQCAQNNATVTLQCVATVPGQHWTNSNNTTATFFVDLHSYNGTCEVPGDVVTTQPRSSMIAIVILVVLFVMAVVLLIIQQLKYRRLLRQFERATADTAMERTNAATDQVASDSVTGGSTYEELQHASRTSATEAQYSRLRPATRGRQSALTGRHVSTSNTDSSMRDYINVGRVRN